MKRMSVAILGFLLLLTVGCSKSADTTPPAQSTAQEQPAAYQALQPLKPPEVKRGPPVLLSIAEYPPIGWVGKSGDDKVPTWFKVENGKWYIDWDAERKPFDTLVIHHSATPTNTTANSIDQSQKERLYLPRYRSANNDPFVKGLPPHSGHVVNGKERFIGYHHLVSSDGKVTTELQPLIKVKDIWYVDMVGWHAGNWDVNCRSLGICLIGDFTDQEPPEAQLKATARLIAYYRTLNPKVRVQPHNAYARTECPGRTWGVWGRKLE